LVSSNSLWTKLSLKAFSIFWFLHILYLLVPPQWTVGTQRLHLSINIHRSKTEINIAMLLRQETTQLIRWHYKPIAAIRILCPSWLSANYNRCPWWTRGNGVIHLGCSVSPLLLVVLL
jgi:hypothetical protein